MTQHGQASDNYPAVRPVTQVPQPNSTTIAAIALQCDGTIAVTARLSGLGGTMNRPLEHVRVLLVEDDPISALDLSLTLETAGATIIGPAHNVASAIALLQDRPFDVAVLDHLIVGGDSLPVAEELSRRGVQFLFHTSHRGALPQRFPHARVIDKPSRSGELVAAVEDLIKASRQTE